MVTSTGGTPPASHAPNERTNEQIAVIQGNAVTGDLLHPPGKTDERDERFAGLISAEYAAILADYGRKLQALGSPVVADPRAREQAIRGCADIITDVVASVRGSGHRADDHDKMLAQMIGQTRADSWLSPADLLWAATAFYEVTVTSLARHVSVDPELLPCFVTAIIALNESISGWIREATLAYTGFLLERVDQAHVDERRRIARDLHDRLGEGLSVALRQLELSELVGGEGPAAAGPNAEYAKEALVEAMRRLRLVTSGLRQEAPRSLETSLVQYLDSVTTAADVRLRVSGDESWVPPAVIEEAFLIIREAIRNALTHGMPQLVLIGVTLAPHELHAWIDDNGHGFVLDDNRNPVSAGTGLASMRERAALAGGRLTLDSAPGQGAHIELLIPLPGHGDDRRP
jgi:signal transduction histidine kinase